MLIQGSSPVRTMFIAGAYPPRHESANFSQSASTPFDFPSTLHSRMIEDLQSTTVPKTSNVSALTADMSRPGLVLPALFICGLCGACLFFDSGYKPFGIHYEPLVGPFRDQVDAVVGDNGKRELPAFDFCKLPLHVHRETVRGRGCVVEPYVYADRLLPGPVDMAVHEPHARPFYQAYHETGGEDLGHQLELLGFGIYVGDGFRLRYFEIKLEFHSGL